ncbi:uncharacterized protein F5Z01DRAFT_28929 [Emericellopsis atlantica]|uniref:Uncharacterized protein n=1 Tax=Emericellopsis atlantica TaxID=2614577 RepID=A0A9P7ZY06_9HYPO|nr:uncharacterized protein F5Z01DRAFT_28929 [Emericellopsis atlantica]KAG9259188.1 hypothetical protein F5Z01DRAFT_28929 [Emericellopsis atlantica]
MNVPKPVPSRAALHALRGIAFGTSCSVVLLAEERRRRTEIARAAIDNARKLSTIKSQFGSVTHTEDGQTSRSKAALHHAQPADAPRRRKRQSTSRARSDDSNADLIPAAERRGAAGPDSAGLDRREPPRTLGIQGPSSKAAGHDVPPYRFMQYENKKLPRRPNTRAMTSSAGSGPKPSSDKPVDPKTVPARVDEFIAREPCTNTDTDINRFLGLLKAFVHLLESPACTPSPTETYYDHLNKLLQHCNIKGLEGDHFINFDHVAQRLIWAAIRSDTAHLESCFEKLRPFYRDPELFLVRALSCLPSVATANASKRLLSWWGKDKRYPLTATAVFRVLKRYQYDSNVSVESTWLLFECLQSTGLDSCVELDSDFAFKLHRWLLHVATLQNDRAEVLSQSQLLKKIDASRALKDVSIQVSVLCASACAQHARDCVSNFTELSRILQDSDLQYSRSSINKFIAAWTPFMDVTELDRIIRHAVDRHGIPIKRQWLISVLERYSAAMQHEKMLSWLRFCFDNGCKTDSNYLHLILRECYTHWRVGGEAFKLFEERLRQLDPSLSKMRMFSLEKRDWKTAYIRAVERSPSGSLTHEPQVFALMQKAALKQSWQVVWDEFCAAQPGVDATSARCLSLAVMARIELDAGETNSTEALIKSARTKGNPIGQALTPFLMAQLEQGKDPLQVLQKQLHLGNYVHDMVFTTAARCALKQDHREALVEICEMAARVKGSKTTGEVDFLHSAHSFSNLLQAYSRAEKFQKMHSLLDQFQEKPRAWATCNASRRAIKAATKLMAKRLSWARNNGKGTECYAAGVTKLVQAYDSVFVRRRTRAQKEELLQAVLDISASSVKPEEKDVAKPVPVKVLAESSKRLDDVGKHEVTSTYTRPELQRDVLSWTRHSQPHVHFPAEQRHAVALG